LSRTFPGVNKFVVLRRDALWGPWKLNCRRANFASRVVSKQNRCVSCWSVCSDDRTAHWDKHLDRRRIHGSAAWFYRVEWHGTDNTSGESVFRTCVCVSWAAGRSEQDVVVGRRWAVQSHYRKPTVSYLSPGGSFIRG